ncbi:hypothetical protein PHISP_03900 [Aspergillus sp. HF37]|nr:hypothetical protein PHISP_03900 [Aspergillus sp. HF37]
MAKRHRRSPTDPPESDGSHASGTAGGKPASELPQREPASLGKLHEIDLGQETKLRNIARTEAATKRLVDDDVVPPGDEAAPAPPTKDEKPWRNRKRRNSEDMERDRLVEEVMRESKLDVYDEPEEGDRSDDQAADDKIAEQFRRDFLDAIQSRRRVARAKNTKPANKPEPPKGPKLGGSRSARAAMREMQEKSGQK